MCDDSCATNAPRSFWSVQAGAGVGVTLFLPQSVPLRDAIYKLKINTSLWGMSYKQFWRFAPLYSYYHITPVLCELHRLPIQYRIIFKILLRVYKSLTGTSRSYLAQKLHYRSHTRSLRSVSNELLMQPRSYTKTYGDRAFAVHAPREWNLIPYEIRKSNTISSFKRSFKTYLFTKFSNNRSLFL